MTLRVSGTTDPGKLAKSIVMTMREDENGYVAVRAVGATAVNQLVKALIIARSRLAAAAEDMDMVPAFDTVVEDGNDLAVIVWHLHLHSAA